MKLTSLFVVCSLTFVSGVASSQDDVKEFRKTLDLRTNGRVFLDTYKGTITIDTWDKPRIDIYAKIEPDGWGRDERRKVRDTEIRVREFSDRVEIKSDYHKLENHHGFWFFGIFGDDTGPLPFVHYTITMPASAQLEIKDYKSDTRIADLRSSLDLNTYKGTVDVRGLDGSIDLETYKGEVRVDFTKLTDDSRFETYKGRIEIALPNESGFDLDADLGRRVDFDSDFDGTSRHKHRNSEQAVINGGGPRLYINSEKGDIRIRKK